jgi:hypothetical protein
VSLSNTGNNAILITDINDLELGGLTQAGAGAVTISIGSGSATASLTQSGAITTGTATASGGTFTINASAVQGTSIELYTQDNLIRSGNIVIGNPLRVNNYQFRNTASVALGNSIVNPDPDGGLANFSGSTKLENVALYYGTLAGVGAAPLNSLGGLKLNNSGGLTLFATAIQQTSGIFDVPGTTSFTATKGNIILNQANIFQNAVSLTSSGGDYNVEITGANYLTLGTLSIDGNLTAISTGALNLGLGSVGGNLTANSPGGGITQTGALTINGTSSITAGAATITLTQALNNFIGAVNLSNTGNNDVSITDANTLTLGTLSVGATGSGGLFATSTGALNLGSGTVTGDLSATSNGGNITLGSAEEALELSVTGALTATSNGGNITQAGAITVGGATFDAG